MAAQTASRKKLIEVSIPLEVINKESAREKSIRHGHPSTLHLWWARRPLAACRAVLFAQLVDDPSACPEEFPTKAAQDAERDRLHKLIAALVPWDASNNEMILNVARYEIARSVARGRGDELPPIAQMKPQQIIDYLRENAAPVYDPFSGGGSIPLEAQRLGLKVIASDLNPVAVLIGKALIEFPPKFASQKPVNPEANELHQWLGAQGLADDVRYYGHWMREQAVQKVGHLYPKVKLRNGKASNVVAWLWVRTVASPDPRAKGAHVPLAGTFVLSAKADKEVVVKPVVDRIRLQWRFEIDDKPSKADIEAAKKGTKAARGANFVCLLTGAAIDDKHVKAEAMAGRMGTALMTIVAEGQPTRVYLPPAPEHVKAAVVDAPEVPEVDQPLPKNPRWFSPPDYGMRNYKDLFTPRQLIALTTFSDLVMQAREKVLADAKKHWTGVHTEDSRRLADGGVGPTAYADAVATYLGFAVAKATTRSCSLAIWEPGMGRLAGALGRQALPMQWTYAETNPIAGAGGDIEGTAVSVAENLERLGFGISGEMRPLAAQDNHFPQYVAIATDPPYYDNIGYADLSDFFYVWHRRTLSSVYPELFRRVLTPKTEELIAAPYRERRVAAIADTDWKKMSPADRAEAFFMHEMRKALVAIAKGTDLLPTTIYYAFKQSEIAADGVTSAGWATFLQAVVESGLAVDATWPVRTEATNALKKDVNALASSIVLVCRRRDTVASSTTRTDFLRALRREMPAALAEIRRGGVGPTDIQQAAIGPGIGIFTRHAHVLNTDGTTMLVRDALKLINQVREEITSSGDADYDSETRFALDWFAAKGFEKGRSGDAIVMTNAVDVSLDGMNAAGFFLADGGVARLLKREELPDDWDPANDGRAAVWEACQHLIKRLRDEDGGIDAAAALYNRLGSRAEHAHALARRLYDICEQNQWAAEGYVYNQLHQEWDVIEKRAAVLAEAGQPQDLFSRWGVDHERT